MAKYLLCLLIVAGTVLAQESPHGGIKFECSACHGTDSWQMRRDASFKHESVGFPLEGQHKMLKCQSCHEDLRFTPQRSDCLSCHTDLHKSELGTDCARCHTMRSWLVTDMVQKHQQTRFPLLGRHSTVLCQTCHVNAAEHQYVGVPTTCIGCHRNEFQTTTAPNHSAAGFSTDCVMCHAVTAATWGNGFDHNLTRFPLTGAHEAQPCASCHSNNVFQGVSAECVACHQQAYVAAANPNHVNAGFPNQCQACHTTTAWRPATFDHNTTKFPLTGDHASLQCQACHTNGNYQLVYTNCAQCHQGDFQGAANPNHVAGNFSLNCQTCHTTTAWRPATFDHNTTRFALTGSHTAQPCLTCHTNNNYQLVYTNCVQCHLSDFQNAANPSHATGNFSQNCETCHNTTAWRPATFDHNATKFPLTGDHAGLQCQSCHTNGNYQLVYTNCAQCHQGDFQGAANPNHVAGNFSLNCQTCHSTTAWRPATFDHNSTKFPLTGDHTGLQCQACHTNGNYQLVYTNCVQCHQGDFQGAVNPNHVAGNFSLNCQTCHTTTAWRPATFDHNTTKFPLTGDHASLQCQACHTNGNYQLVYTNCAQCHQGDFQGAVNPNHVAGNFSLNCQTCHTTTAWRPATFDHNTTRFALTGSHTAQPCLTCHTNNNYQLVYTNCVQCHLSDFQNAANPSHATGNFSQNCETCHNTTAWRPATFDHNATKFPLTGDHAGLQCQSCHTNGNYQLVYTNCAQCHQGDFQGAANPNHVAGNFSLNCQTCHSTTAWQPATFNHSTTAFPLTGAHTAQACQACHTNGNYQLVYNGCIQCHQSNYQATTNPNHASAGFPMTCQTCHTTTAWAGATFNHTWFPTTHGRAGGVCSTCHTNPSDFSVFQCTNCHTKTQTDSHHTDVRNYVYNSTNCYQCHPRGNGD